MVSPSSARFFAIMAAGMWGCEQYGGGGGRMDQGIRILGSHLFLPKQHHDKSIVCCLITTNGTTSYLAQAWLGHGIYDRSPKILEVSRQERQSSDKDTRERGPDSEPPRAGGRSPSLDSVLQTPICYDLVLPACLLIAYDIGVSWLSGSCMCVQARLDVCPSMWAVGYLCPPNSVRRESHSSAPAVK